VKEYTNALMKQSEMIDTVLLACTHYPLLLKKIKEYLPADTKIISQGEIVASSLVDYLQRHPEIAAKCLKENKVSFYTTDSTEDFDKHAAIFYGQTVQSMHVDL
jgi:glutamate racemase